MVKQLLGKVSNVTELSKTAREITLTLPEPLGFTPGHFINVFVDIDGRTIERSYSISSSPKDQTNISLSIRYTPTAALGPYFWRDDLVGSEVKLVGPLGSHTADHLKHSTVYLFGFGIGAGIIRSIAHYLNSQDHIQKIVIMTGSKQIDEIIHKNDFDELAASSPKVTVSYAVSQLHEDNTEFLPGYIQDHIKDFDFNNSDVYICGQTVACYDLETAIRDTYPDSCSFFIEAFG
jgi:NAD(P)H-flavin reductase